MPNIPSNELGSITPRATTEKPAYQPAHSYRDFGLNALIATDYRLPPDNPNRVTAVMVTPSQLEELVKAREDVFVGYTQFDKGQLLYSAYISEAVGKPLYLETTSQLRGSGSTEEEATERALNRYATYLGEIACSLETPLRLQ